MTMRTKFRKIPIEVTAIQWTGRNVRIVKSVLGASICHNLSKELGDVVVGNPRNKNVAAMPSVGEWLVLDPITGLSAISAEEFEATYEEVSRG